MRPKVEDFGDYVFILFKTLDFQEEKGITLRQASIILAANFVITFQEGDSDIFAIVLKRIRSNQGKIRSMKSDYLTYSLIDVVVDHYYEVIEKIDQQVEELEDKLIDNPTKESLHEIHQLKELVLRLRKALRPMKEVAIRLERGSIPLVREPLRVYFHDIYENLVQINETIETYRDKIPVMIEIYYASVSHKINEIIKVLTIVATIFLPMSLLVAVFGLSIPISPLISIPVILAIFILMLLFLRQKRWI